MHEQPQNHSDICKMNVEDVQRPVKAIRALYGSKAADSGDNFGVDEHFSQLIASGATVGKLIISKMLLSTQLV